MIKIDSDTMYKGTKVNQYLNQREKEILEIIDIFTKAKIKWAEKPQTMLNKSLVNLLITWEKELKQKIKGEK